MAFLSCGKDMIFALAVTGPTASGKTAISIDLAKRLDAEIISCDSMQIYKEMSIGTAKPTEEERAAVPHHMIDFISPKENFSVESYREMALPIARDIISRGKLPIFVGGTGLYIDSLMRRPSDSSPKSDPEYRERILSGIKSESDIDALWERLNSVDPESAEKIHKNNVKRVIRALEIYESTGKTKTELDRENKSEGSDIRIGMITLDFHQRENLYERVNRRVDVMLEEGLLSEAESLYSAGLLDGETTASQAIGYKELIPYLKGEASLTEALEQLKLSTRRYAKRQLTWFRHESFAARLYLDGEDGIMKDKKTLLEEAFLLAGELINKYL